VATRYTGLPRHRGSEAAHRHDLLDVRAAVVRDADRTRLRSRQWNSGSQGPTPASECARACVCACVRARVRVCLCVCVYTRMRVCSLHARACVCVARCMPRSRLRNACTTARNRARLARQRPLLERQPLLLARGGVGPCSDARSVLVCVRACVRACACVCVCLYLARQSRDPPCARGRGVFAAPISSAYGMRLNIYESFLQLIAAHRDNG
jgi:hypothetical protein